MVGSTSCSSCSLSLSWFDTLSGEFSFEESEESPARSSSSSCTSCGLSGEFALVGFLDILLEMFLESGVPGPPDAAASVLALLLARYSSQLGNSSWSGYCL